MLEVMPISHLRPEPNLTSYWTFHRGPFRACPGGKEALLHGTAIANFISIFHITMADVLEVRRMSQPCNL